MDSKQDDAKVHQVDDGLLETAPTAKGLGFFRVCDRKNHDIAPESYLPRSTWNKGAMSPLRTGRFQWLQDTTTFKEKSNTLEIAVKTTEIKN